MKLILQIVAIFACILLLIQVVYGIIRHYNGDQKLSRGRTIANWIILLVMLLCWGGSQMMGDSPHHAASHAWTSKTAKVHSSSKAMTPSSSRPSSSQAAPKISFKKHVNLDQNGQAIVEFKVPANTELQIISTANKSGLLSTVNPSADRIMPVEFAFSQNGNYDIIAMRGKKKTTSHLTVGQQQGQSTNTESSQSGQANDQQSAPANNGGTHIEYQRRLVPIN